MTLGASLGSSLCVLCSMFLIFMICMQQVLRDACVCTLVWFYSRKKKHNVSRERNNTLQRQKSNKPSTLFFYDMPCHDKDTVDEKGEKKTNFCKRCTCNFFTEKRTTTHSAFRSVCTSRRYYLLLTTLAGPLSNLTLISARSAGASQNKRQQSSLSQQITKRRKDAIAEVQYSIPYLPK